MVDENGDGIIGGVEDAGEDIINGAGDAAEDIIDGVLEFGQFDGSQYAFPKDWTSYEKTTATGR